MNEKELLEIEQLLKDEFITTGFRKVLVRLIAEVRKLKERNAQITQNYNKRVEKYYYLQQEVKRLRELRNNVAIAHQVNLENLAKESQLYKDLYTKANTQNMLYKVALEFYADSNNYSSATAHNGHDVISDNGEIANKTLEVKHD